MIICFCIVCIAFLYMVFLYNKKCKECEYNEKCEECGKSLNFCERLFYEKCSEMFRQNVWQRQFLMEFRVKLNNASIEEAEKIVELWNTCFHYYYENDTNTELDKKIDIISYLLKHDLFDFIINYSAITSLIDIKKGKENV